MMDRQTLFALAETPIGGAVVQQKADAALRQAAFGEKPPAEVVEAARRASKIWLPEGKRSPNSREVREAEQEARARNYDLEDAIEACGGSRGRSQRA